MSQGTIHTEPIIRTRPFAGEFDGDGQAVLIAREAMRANRRGARRATMAARREAMREHAAEMAE